MSSPQQLAYFLRAFAFPLLLAQPLLAANPVVFPARPAFVQPQGQGPIPTFSPTAVSFGNQAVGTSTAPVPVTVTNTGSSALIISGIKLSGVNQPDFSQTNNCRGSIAPQASCTITVTFTPTAVGNRVAAVVVTDNAGTQSVNLTGAGTAPVQLSVGGLNFGSQLVGSTSGTQSFSVTNASPVQINFSGITTTGDFSQTNNCGTSLAPAGVCSVTVTFAPSAGWSRGGSVVIADSAAGSPQLVVLAGMGYAGAMATLSTTSLAFGQRAVGGNTAKNFSLTNNGTAALSLSGIFVDGDFTQSNTCISPLNPAATCTVTVTFLPTVAGRRLGHVTLLDTDSSLIQTVNLTGTGTVPSTTVSISPVAGSLTLSQTLQFTASISGQISSNVTWSVDGIGGGNSTTGTISSGGLYTPPTTAGAHSISAASIANPGETVTVPVVVTNYPGTFTQKNDTMRTGQNLQETVLTTGNVNQTQFGKLFSCGVDGYIYGQPLYVQNVSVPGLGFHNVVYVVTENDSVYAFDADNPVCQTLWSASLLSAGYAAIPRADLETGNDLTPIIGITATPVIDPLINTMFVLARSVDASTSTYAQTLYALDITTGAQKAGSPMPIQPPPVNGKGEGSSGGLLSFDLRHENARTGLLLANGIVYMSWGSLEDIQPFHGWVLGYNETSLQLAAVWVSTPNGSEGGIWQGGGGLAADSSDNIFLATGNGTFDAAAGGADYGSSVVKLTNTGSSLTVADYFAPFNQLLLTDLNWDLGAGGVMLLPDQTGGVTPHLALAGGKASTIYLLNRDALGQFSSAANQVLLTLPAAIGPITDAGGSRGGPAYWQEQIYYAGSGDTPKQFSMLNGMISSVPVAKGPLVFGYPGAAPVISANGGTNGILWVLQADQYGASGAAVLRAYNAANVSHELYDSKQQGARDTPGPAVKFSVPTVANGKVYVGTQNQLNVFGLLP
jgi:hypothetical protein